MATFAVLSENIVTNIIVADSLADAETATGLTCVEYTSENPAFVGYGYDGVVFEQPFTAPVSEGPVGE